MSEKETERRNIQKKMLSAQYLLGFQDMVSHADTGGVMAGTSVHYI